MPETYEILKDAGMAAVVVWVLWWTFTKHIPAILKEFSENLTKQADTFTKALEEQRKDFLVVLEGTLKQVDEHVVSAGNMMAAHDRMLTENTPKCMR